MYVDRRRAGTPLFPTPLPPKISPLQVLPAAPTESGVEDLQLRHRAGLGEGKIVKI